MLNSEIVTLKVLKITEKDFYTQRLYGSRKLNVHTEKSDYDFLFLEKDNIDLFFLNNFKNNNSEYQLLYKPKYGKINIYRKVPTHLYIKEYLLDELIYSSIMLLSDERDLEIVKKALRLMRTLQKNFYQNKLYRIIIFNVFLGKLGFELDEKQLINKFGLKETTIRLAEVLFEEACLNTTDDFFS